MNRHDFLDWAKMQVYADCGLAHSSVDVPQLHAFGLELLKSPELAGLLSADNQWGHPRLLHGLAQRYHLPEAAFLLTPGASSAIFLLCTALLQPNDQAIVEAPNYEPIVASIEHCHAQVIEWPRQGDWSLDLNRLEALITPKTRLIFLTNLHNPTSRQTSQSELKHLHALVLAKMTQFGTQIQIIVDEIYWDLVALPSFRSVVELGKQFIAINSLSKVYGLGWLRCGWITAEPALIQQLRQTYKTVINIGSSLTEAIAGLVIEQLDQYQAISQAHVAHNRRIVERELAELLERGLIVGAIPEIGCTFFAKLNAPQVTVAKLADQCHVVPGAFFGLEYAQFMRIGFGGESALLQNNLQQLCQMIQI